MSTWNPIRWREMTKEEQESFPDWTMITDDPLPDSGEPVLVTVRWTHYKTGELHYDVVADEWDEDTGSWDSNDTDDVVAWMPMIEPYKEGVEDLMDEALELKKILKEGESDEV